MVMSQNWTWSLCHDEIGVAVVYWAVILFLCDLRQRLLYLTRHAVWFLND